MLLLLCGGGGNMADSSHGKENILEEGASRRNSRRSSILKDLPDRKPLECIQSNTLQRRSLKRVSFADTNTIKEFLATMEMTEWNSTYEMPIAHDSSTSMDISVAEKSMRVDDDEDNDEDNEMVPHLSSVDQVSTEESGLGSNTVEQLMKSTPVCGPQTGQPSAQVSEEIADLRNFIANLLDIKSPTATSDEMHKGADVGTMFPTSRAAVVTRDDLTQKVSTDMEMTCPVSQAAVVTRDDLTQKVSTDMEMTCPVSQVALVTRDDLTQKVSTDMEMTCPVSQAAVVTRDDLTQKVSTDMEMTCPVSQAAVVTRDDLTQKVSTDMEMTCPVSQAAVVTRDDLTQKVGTDMEMTCPVSRVALVTRDDLTQKVSTDMEMTCPVSQAAVVTRDDLTQKVSTDMEMTCPVSRVALVTRDDLTQKVSTDMEMTCPVSQAAVVTRDDLTQKVSTDMEMTCPVSQAAVVTRDDLTQKVSTDMEMTCPVSQAAVVTRDDLTQKVSTDMEMTCPVSQAAVVTRDDLTQKSNIVKYIPCSVSQDTKLVQGNLTRKAATAECKSQQENSVAVTLLAQASSHASQEDVVTNGSFASRPTEILGGADAATFTSFNHKEGDSSKRVCDSESAPSDLEENAIRMSLEPEFKKFKASTKDTHTPAAIGQVCSVYSSDVGCFPDSGVDLSSAQSGVSTSFPFLSNPLSVSLSHSVHNPTTPSHSVHNPTTPSHSVHNPTTPSHSVHNPTTPSHSVHNPTTPSHSVHNPTTPSHSVHNPTTPSHSVHNPTTPSHSVHNPTTPSHSVHNPTTPSQTVHNPSTPSHSAHNPTTPSHSVHSPSTPSHSAHNPTTPSHSVHNPSTASHSVHNPTTPSHSVHNPTTPFHTVHNPSTPSHSAHNPTTPSHSAHNPTTPSHSVHSPSTPSHSAHNPTTPSHSVHNRTTPSHSVHNPTTPSHTVHNPTTPSHTVHNPTTPSHSVHNPTTPSHSVHNPTTPSHSAHNPTTPSHSVHNPTTPSHNAHNPTTPSHSVHNPSTPSHSAHNPTTPSHSVHNPSTPSHSVHNPTTPSHTVHNPSAPSLALAEPSLDNTAYGLRESGSDKDEDNCTEEILDDINVSLVSVADNSTESVSSPPAAAQKSPPRPTPNTIHSKGVHDLKLSRRKSLADYVDELEPLISSVIELADKMETSQSDIYELQDSMLSHSFPLLNKLTNLSISQPEGCNTEQYLPESSLQTQNCIASTSEAEQGEMSVLSTSNLNHSSYSVGSVSVEQQSFASRLSLLTDNISLTGTCEGSSLASELHMPLTETSSLSRPVDKSALCIQMEERRKQDDIDEAEVGECSASPSMNEATSDAVEVRQQQQQCDGGCCLLPGSLLCPPRGDPWIMMDAPQDERRLKLQHSPLELSLTVLHFGKHLTVNTANWSPQPSKMKNACGKLALSTVGCYVAAAVPKLCGLTLCEMGDALADISAAFQHSFNLIIELQLLAASYLTSFLPDSVKVTLFKYEAHVRMDVVIRLEPPQPTLDQPYTLHPSATIKAGNLSRQTVEEEMARVSPGPRQLLRMVKAVDALIQSLPCRV
nr:mucin-12-like isoform X2 [Procambarus clarkii]